jgi:7-carboxy-7-deazaguanine synthase
MSTTESKKFPVSELFGPTLQGEGLTIGQRTVFLRMGGCDYRCGKCDSMHAVDPQTIKATAKYMTSREIIGELFNKCDSNNCSWVTFSGGNPCIWDLSDVVDGLINNQIGVTVETQGTIWQDWLPKCDYITISPKGPGMESVFHIEAYKYFINNLQSHPGTSIKIVIFDARDLEFASLIAEISPKFVASDRFYLSVGNPNPPELDPILPLPLPLALPSDAHEAVQHSWQSTIDSIERLKELVEDVKEYPSLKTARILPQLHTLIWGDDRGR